MEFTLNIILHVLILFTFLSLFFFLYVSKIEQGAFRAEISNLIQTNLGNALKQNPSLIAQLNQVKPALQDILKLYQSDSGFTIERNILVKFSAVFVIILLFCLFVSIILSCRNCRDHIDVKGIIMENIYIFGFVGIIEWLFFTKIAIKYIPTTPSLMVNTLISTINSKFKN